MDVGSLLVSALIVPAVGLILAWLGHGRFQSLETRMDRLRERIDQTEARLVERIDHTEARLSERIDRTEGRLEVRIDGLEGRMASFQASLDAMRSDLTAVALAVGAGPGQARGA